MANVNNKLIVKNNNHGYQLYAHSSLWLIELKKLIASRDAVSFDFFDTLFVRTLLNPEDLFDILGRRFNIHNFRNLRRAAQAEAFRRMLQNGRNEITLENIYDCFKEGDVSRDELMHAEYESELLVGYPNPEMIMLFEEVVQDGKPVIITSDMYLPSSFFLESLRRHGHSEVPLFISSDRNATKRDRGELFDIVAKDLGLKPERILHIGDNQHSDIKQAKAKGIATYHYNEQRKPPELAQYSPDASLARGLVRKHSKRIPHNSFQELGFLYGGPAAVAFLDWIIERAQSDKIDQLLLVARDGYILDRIAKSRTDEQIPKMNYFLGSRTVFTLASITESNFNDFLPYLLSGSEGLSPYELLERINVPAPSPRVMKDLGFGDETHCTHNDFERLSRLLMAYRWEILKVCQRNRRGLFSYIKELGIQSGSRVAFVDVGWEGTTQDAFETVISEFIDLEIFGYYFCLADTPKCKKNQQQLRMNAIFSHQTSSAELLSKIYRNRAAVELFFSAPHHTVVGLDSSISREVKPIYDPGRGGSSNRPQISSDINEGILEFASSFKAMREQTNISTVAADLAMPLIEFATSSNWLKHPLMQSLKNFDAWSSTRNRHILLQEY